MYYTKHIYSILKVNFGKSTPIISDNLLTIGRANNHTTSFNLFSFVSTSLWLSSQLIFYQLLSTGKNK